MNNITYPLYKYMKAWVTFNIPTVYTNAFSYYETCSKLIYELNILKNNQNITSENYDKIAQYVVATITSQQKSLTDFESNIQEQWNTYKNGKETFENDYFNSLNTTVTTFINKLTTMTSNFLKELEETYSGYTSNIETISHTTISEFENKLQEYRTLIQNSFKNINNNINPLLQGIENDYINLMGVVSKFRTDFQALLNANESIFNEKIDKYVEEINNLPEEIVYSTDLTNDIINWAFSNPSSFPKNSLFKKLNYMQATEPSLNEGEYWYNTDTDILYVRQNNENVIVEPSSHILYMFDYHLYYKQDAVNLSKEITIPNSFLTNLNPIISYHDKILLLYNYSSKDFAQVNIETNEVETWHNIDINFYREIGCNYTDTVIFANNNYYFSISGDNDTVKNYYATSVENLINKVWTEIVDVTEGYPHYLYNFKGGVRYNGNGIPCTRHYVDEFQSGFFWVNTEKSSGIPYKGKYSTLDTVLSVNDINQWAYFDSMGYGHNETAVQTNGYGTDILCYKGYVCNGIGFAKENTIFTTNNQVFEYKDSLVGTRYFLTDKYYYKFVDNILRRVNLITHEVKDFEVDESDLVDMIDDYTFYISKVGTDSMVNLISYENIPSKLVEINYKEVTNA